jgi:hypothetical protein
MNTFQLSILKEERKEKGRKENSLFRLFPIFLSFSVEKWRKITSYIISWEMNAAHLVGYSRNELLFVLGAGAEHREKLLF